jgi:hypothetical protein
MGPTSASCDPAGPRCCAPRSDRDAVVVIGVRLLRPGRAGAASLHPVGPWPVLFFVRGAGQGHAVCAVRGGPAVAPAPGGRPGLWILRRSRACRGGTRREAPGGHRSGRPARARPDFRGDRRGGRGGVSDDVAADQGGRRAGRRSGLFGVGTGRASVAGGPPGHCVASRRRRHHRRVHLPAVRTARPVSGGVGRSGDLRDLHTEAPSRLRRLRADRGGQRGVGSGAGVLDLLPAGVGVERNL